MKLLLAKKSKTQLDESSETQRNTISNQDVLKDLH